MPILRRRRLPRLHLPVSPRNDLAPRLSPKRLTNPGEEGLRTNRILTYELPEAAMQIPRLGCQALRRFIESLGYFFSPSVKFVTSITDWLPRCESRDTRILLPSEETSL